MPFFLSLTFFVSFLLTFQLFRVTKLVVQKNVEFFAVIELIGHICISFLPMAMPLAGLFAAIYVMGKFSDDNEIIAIKSFGFSKFQIFTPLLLIAVTLGAVLFSMNRNVIPQSQKRFKNEMIRLNSKGLISQIKKGEFFTDIPGITLFAENVREGGKTLEKVFMNISNRSMEQIIMSEGGKLHLTQSSKNEIPKVKFIFYDGNILRRHLGKDQYEKVFFSKYEFPINTMSLTPSQVTKDRMLTSQKLKEEIKRKTLEISSLKKKDERLKRGMEVGLAKTKLEYWMRYNSPLQFVLFIFIGFCFGVKKLRGASNNSSTFGVIFLISYYILFFGGISLAKKLILPPVAVIFIPTIITLAISLKAYRKMDWAS